MKNLLSICLFILSSLTVGAQQMALDQWNEEAKTNIRCLPKYGHVEKTAGQLEADTIFIQNTLTEFTSKRLASEHLIDLGFKYIYHDVKTAMYRFNQAYLLDSANSDIYWGYGGVYMALGDFAKARGQYTAGLTADPKNTHLLTDYGTYFLVQYYTQQPLDEKNALPQLDSAINYMTRSY